MREIAKDEKDQSQNDSQITHDAKNYGPLTVAPSNRSSGCVNRYHKDIFCFCLELVVYVKDHLVFIVWEVEELTWACHMNNQIMSSLVLKTIVQ